MSTALRILRVARDWHQAELARRAGLSREEVSRLERGRHRPQPATAQALADALGVPAEALFPTPTPEPQETP